MLQNNPLCVVAASYIGQLPLCHGAKMTLDNISLRLAVNMDCSKVTDSLTEYL